MRLHDIRNVGIFRGEVSMELNRVVGQGSQVINLSGETIVLILSIEP